MIADSFWTWFWRVWAGVGWALPLAGSLVWTRYHRKKHGVEHDDYDLASKKTPPGTPHIPAEHK